jgi:Flp pilus assembly protein TadD
MVPAPKNVEHAVQMVTAEHHDVRAASESRSWALRVGTAILCLGLVGGCRTTEDMQRDYAQTLTPKKLDAPGTPDTETPKPIQEFKIRAYADADYQRQSMQWSESIEGQVARANRVLEAQFGVRLVIKEIKSWQRGKATSLEAALAELEATDSGTDVDWVVGFVSSLDVFASSQEQLGQAFLPGHHLVLRGMFSLAEVDALNATLDKLSQKERDNVTRERRLHKQTVVFLHEWAHSLGAFHELSGDWIMSPYYDTTQVSFSPESSRLILGSLTHWQATDAVGRQAWAQNYRDEVLRFPAAAAEPKSLEAALSLSERLVANSPGSKPLGSVPVEAPTSTAADRDSLEPVLKSCYGAQSRSPRTDETLAICRRATEVANARPEALLLLGRVLLARKDISEALKVLVRAEALLSASTPDVTTWVYLAQLYDRADTCTGAERAAKQAPGDAGALQVVKDCLQQRRSVALPLQAKAVPFDREHEYVNAVQQAQHDLAAGRVKQARVRIQELENAFPGSPGPALIACMSDGLGSNTSQMKVSCTAANTAAPEASAPWLLLGRVAASEGRWEDAGQCLRQAITLDATLDEAWRRLAAVYSKLGDSKALGVLSADYRAKFGSTLSPRR